MTGYDVVVVGGRVAGASTALLLARAGVRVAVVERAGRGVDTVSTHGLMRAGVLQLSRWGLLRPPRRGRHAADHAHGLPLRRRRPRCRSRSARAPVSTPSTHRAAPCSTGSSSRQPRRRARWSCTTPWSPHCYATRTDACVAWWPRTRGVRGLSSRPPITVGADGIRSSGRRRRRRARAAPGHGRKRRSLPLRRWRRDRRLRVGVRRRLGRRAAAHQRRGHLCLRRDHSGADAPAAPVGSRAGLRHAADLGRPRFRRPGARRAGVDPDEGAGAGSPGTYASRGVPVGRWSGTRATSRTRSPRTA